MKTILSIPSGNRNKKLIKCIQAWMKATDFEIHVTTWDGYTMDALYDMVGVHVLNTPTMQSFAVNHNEIAQFIPDWDIFICGADDLFPDYGMELIEPVCKKYHDKVIWCKDGLSDAQPTHPIVTKGWYEKHGFIFDEDYRHNFCDTDLFVRLLNSGEVVKCFDIAFDHRHPIKTHEKCDEIYNIGNESFYDDERKFKWKHPLPDWAKRHKVPEVKI